MDHRIARTWHKVLRQCSQAARGVADAGDAWPAGAPSEAAVNEIAQTMSDLLGEFATAKAALDSIRVRLRQTAADGQDAMRQIDRATDFLYGPGAAEKINFGLDPKKTKHVRREAPGQVVILSVEDGVQPSSLRLDFATVEGAAYEIQWFADAALTQPIGSTTTTESQAEIANLTRGVQYWFRVRAIRASRQGPWSDVATRVANV